ncbi:MAG TPA: hypothetical protein VGR98_12245 [Streptosporangiaceae bacterium]|nr:hypothetical protein [Streptosporangiaceae bacterium]
MSSAVGKRRRPRPLVPGKQAEIRWPEYGELLAARAALHEAKLRLRRVTTRLERAIGDAEFGAVDSVPVIWREQAKTGGHYVRTNWREDLRPVGPPLVDDAPVVAPVLHFSPPAQALIDRIMEKE